MAVMIFQDKVSFHGGFGFSPSGETGEGFSLQYNTAMIKRKALALFVQGFQNRFYIELQLRNILFNH